MYKISLILLFLIPIPILPTIFIDFSDKHYPEITQSIHYTKLSNISIIAMNPFSPKNNIFIPSIIKNYSDVSMKILVSNLEARNIQLYLKVDPFSLEKSEKKFTGAGVLPEFNVPNLKDKSELNFLKQRLQILSQTNKIGLAVDMYNIPAYNKKKLQSIIKKTVKKVIFYHSTISNSTVDHNYYQTLYPYFFGLDEKKLLDLPVKSSKMIIQLPVMNYTGPNLALMFWLLIQKTSTIIPSSFLKYKYPLDLIYTAQNLDKFEFQASNNTLLVFNESFVIGISSSPDITTPIMKNLNTTQQPDIRKSILGSAPLIINNQTITPFLWPKSIIVWDLKNEKY